ncbi:hypothetical protein NUU61_001404 [Penicillium alfredii]|uniref:Uncharacterized protein n=1 Tax=Penicillium alfredii TaxID=1506179 RepID=A0A9W9G422_9EURO|nr:uncharacterized protein NUU61_001404 [Penicillium alfredii]KAJ5111774.1 hypothetical protein NUU61_001404 [Penicillium alfredii]
MTSSDELQRPGATSSLSEFAGFSSFQGHGLLGGFHALIGLARLIDLSASSAFAVLEVFRAFSVFHSGFGIGLLLARPQYRDPAWGCRDSA